MSDVSAEPRTWDAFASQGTHALSGEPMWLNVWMWRRALLLSGIDEHDIIEVRLIEDPDGDQLGWVAADDERGTIKMVQHRRIFPIQFPYGYEAEVADGRGEAVPLRIERR